MIRFKIQYVHPSHHLNRSKVLWQDHTQHPNRLNGAQQIRNQKADTSKLSKKMKLERQYPAGKVHLKDFNLLQLVILVIAGCSILLNSVIFMDTYISFNHRDMCTHAWKRSTFVELFKSWKPVWKKVSTNPSIAKTTMCIQGHGWCFTSWFWLHVLTVWCKPNVAISFWELLWKEHSRFSAPPKSEKPAFAVIN